MAQKIDICSHEMELAQLLSEKYEREDVESLDQILAAIESIGEYETFLGEDPTNFENTYYDQTHYLPPIREDEFLCNQCNLVYFKSMLSKIGECLCTECSLSD